MILWGFFKSLREKCSNFTLYSLLSVFFLFNLTVLHLRNQNCIPCPRYHCLLLPGTIARYEILLHDIKFLWELSFMKRVSSYLDFPSQNSKVSILVSFSQCQFSFVDICSWPSPFLWLHNEHWNQRWRIWLILRQMEVIFFYLLHSSNLSKVYRVAQLQLEGDQNTSVRENAQAAGGRTQLKRTSTHSSWRGHGYQMSHFCGKDIDL